MIHLYALTDGPVDLDGLVGVDDGPVRTVACPPLRAVVSDHEQAPGATRERALAHARIVGAVCERTSALPVRYGDQHADETGLCRAVREQAAHLVSTLDRLGGHVEFVVRYGPGDGPASGETAPGAAARRAEEGEAAGGSGRAYLEGRLAAERSERHRRAAASAALHERTAPLARLAVDVRDRSGPGGPERCLLVRRDDVEALREAARAVVDDPALVVGGPWPPYSFVAGA